MDGAKLRYAALKTTEGFSFPFLSLIPLIHVSHSVSQSVSQSADSVALWTAARRRASAGAVGDAVIPLVAKFSCCFDDVFLLLRSISILER